MEDCSIDYLKNIIQKYKYISFDLFDTLLFRTVSEPCLIFDLMVKLLNDDMYKDFRKKRIEAEKKARIQNKDSEVNLGIIYSFLNYSQEVKSKLMSLEKQCEISNCVPNNLMVDMANWCFDEGKQVLITTDMYLDRQTIEAILSRIGVKYQKLFISSEEGATKRSGKLFKIVLRKLNISPKEMVHIGDDSHNDIDMAKANGIDCYLRLCYTRKGVFYKQKAQDVISDHLLTLTQEKSRNIIDENIAPFRIGYSVLGPFLVDFCQWVHAQKENNKIEKLMFIAREGYLIKQCYDIMYPGETTLYLYLNKNLLRLPLLSVASEKEKLLSFISSIPEHNIFKWSEICRFLLLDDLDVIRNIGIDVNEELSLKDIRTGKYDDKLRKLINIQKEKIDSQRTLLNKYIIQNGLDSCNAGLVNNSINGTGQSLLESFLESAGYSSVIYGLQFVKSKRCSQVLAEKSHGWINDSKLPSYALYDYTLGCFVLEHLMFESKGTAFSFVEGEGHICVKCEQQRKERLNNNVINKIQKYALEFARDYHMNIDAKLDYVGANNFLHFLLNPIKEDALIIGNLYNDDYEGDKLLSDTSISLPLLYPLVKGDIDDILWKQGYFRNKNVPLLFLYLYNLKNKISYYVFKRNMY